MSQFSLGRKVPLSVINQELMQTLPAALSGKVD